MTTTRLIRFFGFPCFCVCLGLAAPGGPLLAAGTGGTPADPGSPTPTVTQKLPVQISTKIHAKRASADLELIRTRIIGDLLEPAVNESEISELVKTLQPDGTWPDINYQDVSRTGFQHSQHLEHMLALSRAYKKPGSAFNQSPEVKAAISKSLNFWLKHDFICDNWWWNEMGTPHLMINTLLVMDEDLTETQRQLGLKIANRANLEAFGARPGGDLIQIAGMLGKQGLLVRDEATMERVVKVMAEEIKVSTGRGLKPDLSFHHRTDNVISTLSYGTGYASSFAYWAVKTAGTKFSLPEESLKLLIDYFLDGISQSMVHGTYPDPGAKNRGITRRNALAADGPALAQNLMAASNYRQNELAEIVKIRKGEIKPNLSGTRYFWHSSYFTHQRPDYFVSVRMHSDRGNNMEEPYNGEGLKNHHYADGSNFVSRTGKEYFNIFPTWDWQKIPGTTVVQKPELPPAKELFKKGRTDFSGGVTDGEVGAAAFDFVSVHDPLQARKAWFFFDQEYVSLGAGIKAEAAYPVATTLNQSLLHQAVVVRADKKQETLPKGEHTLANVAWVTHDQIAYVFPEPTDLHLKNTTATGSWKDINQQTSSPKGQVTEEVFTLWINHGLKPQNASYAYIVVPNTSDSEIEAYLKKSGIKILANTPALQAVQNTKLGQSQVVFYQAGSIKVSNRVTVTAQSPCLVLVKTTKKGIEKITVSDPTQKLKTLDLKVSTPFVGDGTNWKATWDKKSKTSRVQITLPEAGMAGQSVVLVNNGKK